ncbi:MAG: beta galactosidase jelly roll domain-containing protein [Candidatus Sumerlaeia bacterium]|nr:beta galactosidase jelly roll domain-containing protein [Candidatus Sumerlaeia bacterium]
MIGTILRPTLPLLLLLPLLLGGCSRLGLPFFQPCHDGTATTLHGLFADGAVLQRGVDLPVWGWDRPGRRVVVTLDGEVRRAVTDREGRWEVVFPPMEAGGPHELLVSGSTDIRRHDILIGEVWLASGQSNMEWPIAETDERDEALEVASQNESIRIFTLPYRSSMAPEKDVEPLEWITVSPENVEQLAAVPWWFANKIQPEVNVPVGIIVSSWGGTMIPTWVPRERLLEYPGTRMMVLEADREVEEYKVALEQYLIDREAWREKAMAVDPGNRGAEEGWHLPDHDLADWGTMELPTYWQATGLNINGVVWFRTDVDLPADWAGHELELHLGAIDDLDTTYLNGVKVGQTGRDTPGFWAHPRVYPVDGELVREGPNTIAVRVFDIFAAGGFAGDPEEMMILRVDDRGTTIPLAGEWLYKVEYAFEPYTEPSPVAPRERAPHTIPAGVYNGMIAPLIPYSIRGFLWYQGESDGGHPHLYANLFTTLVNDWRGRWGRGDLPFYFVQIAPWTANPVGVPLWALIREAQLEAWKELPNSGMVVITDAGDPVDIHPRRKRVVGERLARYALRHEYGTDIVTSGPIYRVHQVVGSGVRIHFDHVADGLSHDGDDLTGFELSGVNQIFHPATARIDGDTLVLESPAVTDPVAIRYGWANVPEGNLVNSAGLPASPFRTDRW